MSTLKLPLRHDNLALTNNMLTGKRYFNFPRNFVMLMDTPNNYKHDQILNLTAIKPRHHIECHTGAAHCFLI